MHFLVPYLYGTRTFLALDEVCQLVHPGDTVTVMAAVVVPDYYAVDVIPGMVWHQTCGAERALKRACAYAARMLPDGVEFGTLRVQGRDEASAIVAAARHCHPDLIIAPGWGGVFGSLMRWCGTVGTVARHTTCGVRVATGDNRTVPMRVGAIASVISGADPNDAAAIAGDHQSHAHPA